MKGEGSWRDGGWGGGQRGVWCSRWTLNGASTMHLFWIHKPRAPACPLLFSPSLSLRDSDLWQKWLNFLPSLFPSLAFALFNSSKSSPLTLSAFCLFTLMSFLTSLSLLPADLFIPCYRFNFIYATKIFVPPHCHTVYVNNT